MAQRLALYLHMMLGLFFANSKQALRCFIRLAALLKTLGWGWTGDTVSTFAPSAGGAADETDLLYQVEC
jgi:hypothetical protein